MLGVAYLLRDSFDILIVGDEGEDGARPRAVGVAVSRWAQRVHRASFCERAEVDGVNDPIFVCLAANELA